MAPSRASTGRITLLFALAALMAPLITGATPSGRPDMKLKVSTHHGFVPLSLDLEGSILGADRSAIASCVVTSEWSYRTPGGQDLISKKESPCVEAATETTLPESFKLRQVLSEPGTYSFRMVLVSRTGKRYASTSQEVKVIKSALEAGGVTTRSGNR